MHGGTIMKVFSLFKPFLKKYKKRFFIFICLSLLVTFLKLYIPLLSGSFIDQLINKPTKNIIIEFTILYICIAIIQIIISYITSLLNVKLQTSISYLLNKTILEHLQKTPILFLEKQNIAYLNQRINADCTNVVSFCLSILVGVFVNLSTLIISFIVIIRVDIWMTLLIICLIISYIFLYKFTKNTLKKIIYELKENSAKYFSTLQEQLSQIRFIKIFNFFDFFKNKLSKDYDNLLKSCLKNQKFSFIFQSSDLIITIIAQVILFVFGGIKIIEGELTIGLFSVLSSYFTSIVSAIKYFISLGNQYIETCVASDRLHEILGIKKESFGEYIVNEIEKIKLDNISFSYNDRNILNDFSYTFEKGKIYCINGENGKGKSTLINLILGMYENYNGSIYYNQLNIKNLNLYLTRICFSVVAQNDLSLNDSILTNIVLDNKTDKENEDLLNYIKLFCIDSLKELSYEDLKNVYINEKNTNFSGGEIKKIMLIRGLMRNNSVLILDEPTNSLDFKSKEMLKKLILDIKENHIIIIVTHDESLKLISDEIIEL